MNGVDEVAVKLVKADKPTSKELTLFHKEVRCMFLHAFPALPTCKPAHPHPCTRHCIRNGVPLDGRLLHWQPLVWVRCTDFACMPVLKGLGQLHLPALCTCTGSSLHAHGGSLLYLYTCSVQMHYVPTDQR